MSEGGGGGEVCANFILGVINTKQRNLQNACYSHGMNLILKLFLFLDFLAIPIPFVMFSSLCLHLKSHHAFFALDMYNMD